MTIVLKYFFISIFLFKSLVLCAQFGVQGSAQRVNSSCFEITPDSLQTDGKIISNRTIDLRNPVTLYTEMYFGNNDDGGEGIAFFFKSDNQENSSTSFPFGLENNQPSISIEFDTYQNIDSLGLTIEPSFDHIALIRDGDFNHSSANNLQGPIIANANGNIEDEEWYMVKIDWNPETNTISAFLNCEEKINYQIDLINDVFGGNPAVFYGFSASAIQAQNQQQVCVVVNTLTDRLQDVILCQGGKTQINAVRGGESYEWSPAEGLSNAASANPVASPSEDVTYSLVVQTGYCNEVLNYEVNIEVKDTESPSEFLRNDTTLCVDEVFTLDATLENATRYSWSNGRSEPIQSFTRSGRYEVTVTLDDECVAEDWARVTFLEIPSAVLPNDTIICQRSEGFVLKPVLAFDNVNYLWNDESTSDSIIVSRQGAYTVEISNQCGSTSDNIIISTEDCRNFYMPNVFSPNLDGINDVVFPFIDSGDVDQISNFSIYNRWGNLVYELANAVPNNQNLGWDGKVNGELAAKGIYMYKLILRFRDGQEILIKGNITLL